MLWTNPESLDSLRQASFPYARRARESKPKNWGGFCGARPEPGRDTTLLRWRVKGGGKLFSRTGDKHVMTISRVHTSGIVLPSQVVFLLSCYTCHAVQVNSGIVWPWLDVPRELIDWTLKDGSRRRRNINQYLFFHISTNRDRAFIVCHSTYAPPEQPNNNHHRETAAA